MRRPVVTLAIGVVIAIVAILMMNMFRPSQQANLQALMPQAPQMELVSVVTAKQDLSFGTPLREDFFKIVKWPKTSAPEDGFQTIESIFSGSDEKRVVIRAMVKNEPVLKTKISGFGGKSTLSYKVGDDKRAFSIKVNAVSAVSGFILPGDRVDIMLTRTVGSGLVTDVILQSVYILGMDQIASEEQENPMVARTATVEVTPDQAQKLALAQQVGSLSLTLRSVQDSEKVKTARITANSLTNQKKKYTGPVVRVRQGSRMSYKSVRNE